MRLEDQLSILEEFGFRLEPDVTLDDLLDTFERAQYESDPFDAIMFVLGIEIECEPWGRRFCRRIWNFDSECIEQSGDYVRIVDELSHVAGKAGALQAVRDHVDLDGATGWLKYRVGGVERHWDVRIDDDWADPVVVDHVMRDLQSDGARFYGKDNGQAIILCYLSDDQAAHLNRLCRGAWSPATVEEKRTFAEAATKAQRGWLAGVRKWIG